MQEAETSGEDEVSAVLESSERRDTASLSCDDRPTCTDGTNGADGTD